MTRAAYFLTCGECGQRNENDSGICDKCAVEHGYVDAPARVQLRRTKGWRMPANTMSVARPGKFGNPFTARGCREAGYIGTDSQIAARCVEAFRVWLGPMWRNNWDGSESESRRSLILFSLPSLRGKNLACWCPLDAPCHADVLLQIANAPPPPAKDAKP